MKIIIGSDHGGYHLKEQIKTYLEEFNKDTKTRNKKIDIIDVGTYNNERCDYPNIAKQAYKMYKKEKNCKLILICGTGIGITNSITIYEGIRSVQTISPSVVKDAVKNYKVNVLGLGGRIVGLEQAKACVNSFLFK